ncbi:hypothetical protein ACQ4PT_039315 [Festuca glaucescens]
MSFVSSSSSPEQQDNEAWASLYDAWASMRARIDATGASLQELRLLGAVGSAVQSRGAIVPSDLPSLRAQIEASTDYFPFEISENKRADAVTLTRALKDEQIKVVVSMPCLDDDDDVKRNESSPLSSNENAKEDEEDEANTWKSAMHLEVTVSKGDGSNLQFTCFADPYEVQICAMYMEPPTTNEEHLEYADLATYDGYDALNEDLKKEFREYLELRGVTPARMNLLRGYLSNKVQRKHTLWLTKLQDFVKKNDLTPEAT